MSHKLIYYFTNLAPLYRESLWKKLLDENNDFKLHIFSGKNLNLGIKEISDDFKASEEAKDRLHRIKNFWLFNKYLIWQSGILNKLIRCPPDHVIFLGECYCLSTWIAAIYCRLKKIDVIFWGHGLYGNEKGLMLFFRKSFYKLSNKHLLYSERSKKLMIQNGFNPDKLYIIYNSLNYEYQKKLYESLSNYRFDFFHNPDKPVLIFIGRLIAEKKVDLLIKAAKALNAETHQVNLLIIGDGVMMNELTKTSQEGIDAGWIYFRGACYDELELSKYLSSADLCASPGSIGLAAIHSLSFGTPVCTHDNFDDQGPEFEAIIDNENGFFFKEDDLESLTSKVEQWIRKTKDKEFDYRKIIDFYYNPDYQQKVFEDTVKGNTST